MARRTQAESIGAECCRAPECCDMRGLLSFLILYLLSKREMYGMEIAGEITKRKAEKPNPGTIYPTLKSLEDRGLIKTYQMEGMKMYRLTPQGRTGLAEAKRFFIQAYGDIVREAD
jgi:DNA-binding PadR family transcriptional regulator